MSYGFPDLSSAARWLPSDPTNTQVALITAAGIIGAQVAFNYLQKSWQRGAKESLAGWLERIPAVADLQRKEIDKKYVEFRAEWVEKYKKFGEPYRKIPEEGLSYEEVATLIETYAEITNPVLADKHMSGTVYLDALRGERPDASEGAPAPSGNDLDDRTKSLPSLFKKAYPHSNLWNGLHSDEFAVAPFINLQLILMVADMFGGAPKDVEGVVTSGGTESLMHAARAYRNWAKETKGVATGKAVIIAPDTIHAALLKAEEDYNIILVRAPTDAEGRVALAELESLMSAHSGNLAAVFASAPSYPTGVVDDIRGISELAGKYGCGMHVDCCLGGFIVNNLYEDANYLQYPHVTSLSCDPHKNGLASKGVSTLITKRLGDCNLAAYGIYAFTNWCCFYATATMAGSQSCVAAFDALLAMLRIGKQGYREIAKQVYTAANKLSEEIRDRFNGDIQIVVEPEVNVLTIRMDPDKFRTGAIYALVHEMEERNVVFNGLQGQIAHFCITRRFAKEKDNIGAFINAMEASLAVVRQQNDDGAEFPGEGALYGALKQVHEPSLSELGLVKYLERWLFGPKVAKKVIAKWVEASLVDPAL